MNKNQISDDVKQFIFEFVDSVEMIEVLIFLRDHPTSTFNEQQISDELRSSPGSVAVRLTMLLRIGALEFDDALRAYRYHPKDAALENLLNELVKEYGVRRHKVLELIFSPCKRARPFADAFRIPKPPKKDGDGRG